MTRAKICFAVGAWGVGNVGDDAIAVGERKVFGGRLVLIGDGSGKDIGTTMAWPDALKVACPGDELVLGGGGTLVSEEVIERHFLPIALDAREAGLKVRIARMGFEGCADLSDALVSTLFAECYKITVRSEWSKDYAQRLGYKAQLVPDFALSIPGPGEREKEYDLVVPNIGNILHAEGAVAFTQGIVEKYIAKGEPLMVVSHVPRHRLNANLDEIDLLEETVNHYESDLVQCKGLVSVDDALETYARAHRVITGRLHGAFFSHICGVPWEPWPLARLKLKGVYFG